MPSLISIAAVTAFVATVFSAPTTTTESTSTAGFSITQASAGRVYKNGPAQVARTFAKFGKTPPTKILTAAVTVQSGNVSADPAMYDEEYLCPVTVGGTVMMLDFDTGSADLWVYSSLLPASDKTGHAIYKTNATKKVAGETWNIGYGDGSGAAGTVYADTVVIGGVTATSQYVEAATYVSSSFQADTANDGLVGLAWPKINSCTPKLCTPFMQNVFSSLAKRQRVFTSALKHNAPGTYDFGYVDASKYSGAISYSGINKAQGFWQFRASVGSASFSTIADTGTTLMYLPDNVCSSYYSTVKGSENTQSGYTFPCSTTPSDFTITIKNVSYTVPGQYLNYSPLTPGSSTCFGGLQSSELLGINILGDVFLKSVFAVFDVGKARIGFAQQA